MSVTRKCNETKEAVEFARAAAEEQAREQGKKRGNGPPYIRAAPCELSGRGGAGQASQNPIHARGLKVTSSSAPPGGRETATREKARGRECLTQVRAVNRQAGLGRHVA